MKRLIGILLLISLLGTLILGLGKEDLRVAPPIVATSMGDGSGSIVLELVARKSGFEAESILALTGEQLKEMLAGEGEPMSLVIATGALVQDDACTVCSAIEIDVQGELDRIAGLIEQAHTSGLPIIGLHIAGGFQTLDRTFEQSIEAIMPYADLIILVNSNESDRYLEELSRERDIPLIKLSNTLEIGDALKKLFSSNL